MQREDQLAQQQATIVTLTKQRDEFYLDKLRLEVRLAKAPKQAVGPRADRIADAAQMFLDFGQKLEELTIRHGDVPPKENVSEGEPTTESATPRPVTRRIRTRGHRDISSLDNLPIVEQKYELIGDLCRCPACQEERKKIGEQVSYTIEHIPASLARIKHIQSKYACPHCEQNGDHPQIQLAEKTGGLPIDKGMQGSGVLAYIATSKYADFTPDTGELRFSRPATGWRPYSPVVGRAFISRIRLASKCVLLEQQRTHSWNMGGVGRRDQFSHSTRQADVES